MSNMAHPQDGKIILHCTHHTRSYHSADLSSDSWIDVLCQPSSSSSVSSAAEDIVTTGLNVQKSVKRRRSLRPIALQQARNLAHSSSQEKYEESESEPDNVMTMPDISPRHELEEDTDDSATAVAGSTFNPRPNAFSHAPQRRQQFAQSSSYDGKRSRLSAVRHSYPSQSPLRRSSTSSQVDHDAVLRASLSTLLSCAAARRPKTDIPSRIPISSKNTISNQIIPASISVIPESAVFGDKTSAAVFPNILHPSTKIETSTRSNSKDRRATRRTRPLLSSPSDDISPTLLTWMVGAGMIVLVSAISFSAGYVVGKEMAYAETNAFNEFGSEVKHNLTTKGSGLGLRKWTRAAVGITA